MKIEELEERIKNGERFFVIYSNDLKQLYIDLKDHDTRHTKCIPHLGTNPYVKPFNAPKPFPIIIEYTDDNEFRLLTTKDKLHILNRENGTFLNIIKVDTPLNINEALVYVRNALIALSEEPFAIDIANIKPLEGFRIWEMEELLNNKNLTPKQREMLEERKARLIKIYETFYSDYREIIKRGDENIQARHINDLKAQEYRRKIETNFEEFIQELYEPKPKQKTLKRSI